MTSFSLRKRLPDWPWALMVALFILGGGRGPHGPMIGALIQLGALIALAVVAAGVLLRGRSIAFPPVLTALVLATMALFVIQLVPLPPTWWVALPGREPAVAALRLVDGQVGWRALSLDPWQTWNALYALIPLVAVMVVMLYLPRAKWALIAKAMIAAALVSGVLALAQVVGVREAFLFNADDLVGSGVFANPNHQVDLMLAGLMLTGWIISQEVGSIEVPSGVLKLVGRTRPGPLRVHPGWFVMAFFALMAGLTGSRAAIMLTPPAIALAISVAVRWERVQRLILFGLLLIIPVMLYLFYGRGAGIPGLGEEVGLTNELRLRALPDLWAAIQLYAPVGSGLGTFDMVFRQAESLALVGPTYLNHAHNDYIEILLETGWIGTALLVAGLGAILARGIWVSMRPAAGRTVSLQIVCVNLLVLVGIHSIIDYPLRTYAISTVCGFALAILFRPSKSETAMSGSER